MRIASWGCKFSFQLRLTPGDLMNMSVQFSICSMEVLPLPSFRIVFPFQASYLEFLLATHLSTDQGQSFLCFQVQLGASIQY